MTKNIFYYETYAGVIGIAEEAGKITNIVFGRKNIPGYEEAETHIIKKTIQELNEYFSSNRKFFDIPINPSGTAFQKQVWNALLSIPYGKTASYKEMAIMCKNEKASRAVGMANNKNPIPIIIPCHRVIGSNGNLTGYAGGLEIKKKLLEIENI